MPIRKKQRVEVVPHVEPVDEARANAKVMCQLVDENGNATGSQILVPVNATTAQLDELLATFLAEQDQLDPVPYAFFINGDQLKTDIADALFRIQQDQYIAKQTSEGRRIKAGEVEGLTFAVPEETVVEIMYKPQANFRVRPVTRCSAQLDGHSEAVLVCSFSPDGKVLATGGGDKEIRLWDVFTLTPTDILKGHNNWVQVLSWAPDGSTLVSGSREGALLQWRHDGEYGNFKSKALKAHSNYVTHVAWEPFHVNLKCERFVSASKDCTMKVWHVHLGLQYSLSGHASCVTCVKWGGEGFIYSSSQDKQLMVWNAETGGASNYLRGHGHWVNFVALNTDLCIRTGQFDHERRTFDKKEDAREYAASRYDAVVKRCGGERLASCSDDNTMYLWNPSKTNTPIGRMTGHQGAVLHLAFSPDGTMLASCGADKSVKLWNGVDGKFITTFRGHVAAVYHVSWSLDSRMLASGSKDTTLKLWSVATRDMVEDLSGHMDEIFSTDWAPDGQRVATGSKDKKVRIWVH